MGRCVRGKVRAKGEGEGWGEVLGVRAECALRYSVELRPSLSQSTVTLLSFFDTHLLKPPKTVSGSRRHTVRLDRQWFLLILNRAPSTFVKLCRMMPVGCASTFTASQGARMSPVTVHAPRVGATMRGRPSHLTFVRIRRVRTVVLIRGVGLVGLVDRRCCTWPLGCYSTATSGSTASACPTTTLAAAAAASRRHWAILLRRICFRRTAGLQGPVTTPNLQHGPFRANDTQREVPAPIGRRWVGRGGERGYLTKPAARRSSPKDGTLIRRTGA